ncbi:MAG: CPCC family cysteine-rich protein [Planctomycetales bacterium]
MSYPCPCCHYLTLAEEPLGTYEVCPVCCWEDDPVQSNDPSFEGGANNVSLVEARTNFWSFGASSVSMRSHARRPLSDEIPNHE